MSSNKRITIVSVCDDHYIILLAALIKSVELNHKSPELIDFYLVEDHVKNHNKEKLLRSVNSSLICIHWLKMSEVIPSDIKLPLDSSSFPLNIYVRLFIPYFIPPHIEKVIYLDVDMIVLRDISLLWETDMNDKMIAGAVDRSDTVGSHWLGIQNYKELGLTRETKYFNSGLLLIKPSDWRQSDITNKILQCIKNNLRFASFPDQYGLNVVFANQWLELDPRWNSQSMLKHPDPYLIHFTGKKPIYKSYNYNQNYKHEFYKYLALTEWHDHRPLGEYIRLLKKVYNKIEKIITSVKGNKTF